MNRYVIRVVGHLDTPRARALGAERCRWLVNGQSVLEFGSLDQAATYGVLARLRDAGIELIAVESQPNGDGDALTRPRRAG